MPHEENIFESIVSIPKADGSIEWWKLTDGWNLVRTDPPISSPASIKQKIVDALVTEATRLGWSVPTSNIILPSFQKGA